MSASTGLRCEHGIWLAREDERRTRLAWFCVDCRKAGWNQVYRYGVGDVPSTFRMPAKYATDQRPQKERRNLTANKSERGNRNIGQCPECAEFFHYEETRNGRRVFCCAECSHVWDAPKRLRVEYPQNELLSEAA